MTRIRSAADSLRDEIQPDEVGEIVSAVREMCGDPTRSQRFDEDRTRLAMFVLSRTVTLREFVDLPVAEIDALRVRLNEFLLGFAVPVDPAYLASFASAVAYPVAQKALIARDPRLAETAIREALTRFQISAGQRAVLSACLAEARRRQLDPGEALSILAEFALDDDRLDITCRALLDCGLVDQAGALLPNLDGTDLSPGQFVERQVLRADIGLASGRVELAAKRLRKAFEDPRLADAGARASAQLALRRDVVASELALTEPALAPAAFEALSDLLATTDLEPEERALAIRAAIFLAMKGGDLAEAERWIALHAAAERARLPTEERAFLVACEARIARLRNQTDAEAKHRGRELEDAWEQALDRWRRMPLRAGGIGFFTYSVRRLILGEMVLQRLAAQPGAAGVEAALDVVMQAGAAGTLARSLGAGECSFAQAKRVLLAKGRGLLVVVPDDVVVHLFFIDGDGEPLVVSREWLYGRESTAVEWLDLLEQRPTGANSEQRARELAERANAFRERVLPAAAQARIAGWNEFYLVGADAMSGSPWEALPFRASVLGVEKAVVRLPSLALGVALATRAQARPFESNEYALVFATQPNPSLRDRWQGLVDLPLDDRERDRLSAPFRDARLTLLMGDEVTADALMTLGARRPRLLHFLGHGVRDTRRETGAALVLAGTEGSALLFHERATQALAARLVVLSACEAADSPVRLGDDSSGDLGSAALLAGADSVILAHGALDYAAALCAAAVLHERLLAGDAPAHALCAARRRLLEDPAFADPYFYGRSMSLGLGFAPLDR